MYIITKGDTHLRSKPSKSSHALAVLGKGYNLKVIEKIDDWFKVKSVSDKVGYVHDSTVTES